MTKIEQAARDILKEYLGGEEPIEGTGTVELSPVGDDADDLRAILEVIADFIRQILEIFNNVCQNGPFARLAKRAGFSQRLRARREIYTSLWHHNLHQKHRTSDILKASLAVAARWNDEDLNEMAEEIKRPDWGIR